MSPVIPEAVQASEVPLARGRQPTKYTSHNIARIKEWVTQGVGREEIAKRLEVTVGSLQVTCSRLGISLRKSSSAKSSAEIRPLPAVQRSLDQVRQNGDSPEAKFTLLIQTQTRQAAFDLPLGQDLIKQLALEASVRGQTTAHLIANIISHVVEKGVIGTILRNGTRG
jgi:hypothetical protein